MQLNAACADDVTHIVGDIDASKVIEILALRPTVAEIEEAAVWAHGDGDILAKSGHPQAGVIAQIVDILMADADDVEPR